jgi:hypothetical protein
VPHAALASAPRTVQRKAGAKTRRVLGAPRTDPIRSIDMLFPRPIKGQRPSDLSEMLWGTLRVVGNHCGQPLQRRRKGGTASPAQGVRRAQGMRGRSLAARIGSPVARRGAGRRATSRHGDREREHHCGQTDANRVTRHGAGSSYQSPLVRSSPAAEGHRGRWLVRSVEVARELVGALSGPPHVTVGPNEVRRLGVEAVG